MESFTRDPIHYTQSIYGLYAAMFAVKAGTLGAWHFLLISCMNTTDWDDLFAWDLRTITQQQSIGFGTVPMKMDRTQIVHGHPAGAALVVIVKRSCTWPIMNPFQDGCSSH